MTRDLHTSGHRAPMCGDFVRAPGYKATLVRGAIAEMLFQMAEPRKAASHSASYYRNPNLICILSPDPAFEPAQPARLATVYNASKIPTSLKNYRIRGTGAQNKVIGLRWPLTVI